MPKKDEEPLLKSPLHSAVKEGDEFKKEVDEFVKECQDVLKDADLEKSAIAVKNLYKKSNDLLEEHGRLQRQADGLKKENEPSKVMRFDSKKKDEIKRLEKSKEKLDKLNKQLEPDEVEEEYLSKVSKGAEVEESEDEEESEEEESEEEAPPPKPNTSKQKVAQKQEEEEEEDDDEEETEDEDDDDDEEEEDSEEETDEEESEEEEDTEGAVQQDQTMRQFVALQDYDAQQEGDLGFSAGDILTITNAREDGWLVAKDTEGNTGLVPSNFLKVYSQYDADQEEEEEDSDEETDPKTPRRIPQRRKTSVTDVLHAMGSLPAGFREATLGKMATKDAYTMKNYLAPKLSPSCVSFRDLFFDASTNKIRARSVRVQRIVTVMVCRQIPLPGTAAGVEVLSRHLRACLFDGKNVLSNIHTIRIQGLDKTQNTWNFNTKATETMKTLEFADFFIRTNSSEGNIGILFELGLTYIRTSTGQEGEFSCGWVHMPLFDSNGAPAQNKTYDLFVNGGTPYEKGVDVDPSVGRRASTNLFRSLMSGNRQPRLSVRLQAPTKEQKDLLDTLPDVCVSSTAYIQYLSFYRQILTDAVIRDCVEPRSTDLIHNPLLASFPSIADQPELMDVLRISWAERLKTAKRSEKKDSEALKQLYVKLFMDTVYPLVHSASIPPPKFGDIKVEEERLTEIQRLQKLNKEKKIAGAILLSGDTSYTPFDTCEMAFNVLGPHCVSRQ